MSTRFDTYSEYSNAPTSEKLTLAHVSAFQRLYNFTLDSGNLYKRVTNHLVTEVKRLGVDLTMVTSSVEVDDETKFYFDINENTLYLYSLSGDLASDKIIVNYRLFFSSGPIALAWNLGDNDLQVEYEPRILAAPAFSSKIGTNQQGISVTGSGSLALENGDGFFDPIYDLLTFEQKSVEIYSFHRDLLPSESKILYRGLIVDKSFGSDKVTFQVKDNLFKLDERIPLTQYTEGDDVSQQFVGDFRRRLYGKLDGLLIRSIDQISTGFTLTGTVTNALPSSTILTGTGTLFLDECSPGDKITIESIEYQIDTVSSNTSITIGDSDGLGIVFENVSVTNLPERPWRKKNRSYIVADHAIKQVKTDLVRHPQLNRIEVLDTEGFEENDVIEIGSEVAEVKRVSGNLITTRFNLTTLVSTPADVLKRPLSNVYIEGTAIVLDDIVAITNDMSGCTVEISALSEFNITLTQSLPSFADFTFTNGLRSISTTADIDLTQYIQPRDWIKSGTGADTEFYEILSVGENSLEIRTPFAQANTTETAAYRAPELAGDDSNVSSDVLGKTKDGTPEGDWIKTGAEVVQDLLEESSLSDFIDTVGFDEATSAASQLISMALPNNITDKQSPKIRDVINDINTSIFGSLVLTNNLFLTYNVLDINLPDPDNLRRITESDNVKWTLKASSGKLVKSSNGLYRPLDFDNVTKTQTTKSVAFTSEFVEDFETSLNTEDLELFVYREDSAQELIERYVYYNSLANSEIKVIGSLNLADIAMGDKVILDLDRLYLRMGDSTNREKVGTVVGVNRTGDNIVITISDLGNIYSRSGIITDNAAPEFASATSDDKITDSYITDNNGLTDTDEDTVNTNLIT